MSDSTQRELPCRLPAATDAGLQAHRWSCADRVETQRQAMAHNSVYNTPRKGKRVRGMMLARTPEEQDDPDRAPDRH